MGAAAAAAAAPVLAGTFALAALPPTLSSPGMPCSTVAAFLKLSSGAGQVVGACKALPRPVSGMSEDASLGAKWRGGSVRCQTGLCKQFVCTPSAYVAVKLSMSSLDTIP